jgi:hypothetical protein
MNMSIAAIPFASLRKKLRQVGEGERGRRIIYLQTVA